MPATKISIQNATQIINIAIVNEAIKRLGGPWTGDPRWY